jgi:D-alanyl-D-alanine endopeptidase (penicillin-binding protein 7)
VIFLYFAKLESNHNVCTKGELLMKKSVLAALFSVLFVVFSIPTALAKESSATSVHRKKSTAKKVTVAKKKSNGALSQAGHHKRVKKVAAAVLVVPEKPTVGDMAGLHQTQDPLDLKSSVAFVMDQTTSQVLFEKNSGVSLPMASITKLMTSLVVLDARQDMNEMLEVTPEDVDRVKNSHSRLRVGAQLSRSDMLHIALMSSENRAASALGRCYPGGLSAFVKHMNEKARTLGMTDTHYVDSNGLSSQNVASARDLAKLVNAAYQYPLIRQYSTDAKYVVEPGGHALQYSTSNRLVASPDWEIGLQKTGYITEAGRCLVMQARIDGRPVVMVFLDSKGKQSRLGDATRVRKWLETTQQPIPGDHVVAQKS